MSSFSCMCVLSRVWLLVAPWTVAEFLRQNTGSGCHFLFQGIFPTQASNPCLILSLLLWQADALSLCYLGSSHSLALGYRLVGRGPSVWGWGVGGTEAKWQGESSGGQAWTLCLAEPCSTVGRIKCPLLLILKHFSGHDPSHITAQERDRGWEWEGSWGVRYVRRKRGNWAPVAWAAGSVTRWPGGDSSWTLGGVGGVGVGGGLRVGVVSISQSRFCPVDLSWAR